MQDVRRIAFVTAHFLELQGLIPAVYGALLLVGGLVSVVGGIRHGSATDLVITALIFTNLFTLSLNASYKRTFGDVVATRYQKLLGMLPMLAFSLGAMTDLPFDGQRPGPSIGAITFASYWCGILVRDWRWRPHHLISVAAGLAAAVVTAAVPPSGGAWGADPARAEAFTLAYILIGVAMVVTGLCDHQLLARALRPRDGSASSMPAARRHGWFGVATMLAAAVPLSLPDKWLPAFPGMLMIATLAAFMLLTWADAIRALRDFPKGPIRPIDKGLVLDLHPAEFVVFSIVAIVAAVQLVLLRDTPPLLLALAVSAGASALALMRTPRRRFYVLTALTTVASLAAVAMLPPDRGVLSLFCAFGAATLGDALASSRRPSGGDVHHAHTV